MLKLRFTKSSYSIFFFLQSSSKCIKKSSPGAVSSCWETFFLTLLLLSCILLSLSWKREGKNICPEVIRSALNFDCWYGFTPPRSMTLCFSAKSSVWSYGCKRFDGFKEFSLLLLLIHYSDSTDLFFILFFENSTKAKCK